jgi:hypothetical protein
VIAYDHISCPVTGLMVTEKLGQGDRLHLISLNAELIA